MHDNFKWISPSALLKRLTTFAAAAERSEKKRRSGKKAPSIPTFVHSTYLHLLPYTQINISDLSYYIFKHCVLRMRALRF